MLDVPSDAVAWTCTTKTTLSDFIYHFVIAILRKSRVLSEVNRFARSNRDFDRRQILRRDDMVVNLLHLSAVVA
jgi:hypothetical protein